jgi:hypothetical protein
MINSLPMGNAGPQIELSRGCDCAIASPPKQSKHKTQKSRQVMTRTTIAALSIIALTGLGACTYSDGTRNTTGTGATVGAVTGAAAGNLIGGDSRSTLIGGLVGAGAGAAIGSQQQ